MLPEMEDEPPDAEDTPSPWGIIPGEPPVPELGTEELPNALVLPDIEDELSPMLDPELDDPPPALKSEPEEPTPVPELGSDELPVELMLPEMEVDPPDAEDTPTS